MSDKEKDLEGKNKKILELEHQLETLKSTATASSTKFMNSIPEDEVAKLDQLADSINTEVSDVALM